MKYKYFRTITVIIAFAVLSIYLSGCMMAGMGVMHGSGSHDMGMGNQIQMRTVIKEYNTKNYKIIAEFPSAILSNTDVIRLKVVDNKSRLSLTDVDLYIEISSQNSENHNNHSPINTPYRINYTKVEDNYFIFVPKLDGSDNYILKFYINKIGDETFNPSLEIDYTTDNHNNMNHNHSSDSGNILTSPYFYIGTIVMTAMMAFMIF